MRTADGFEAVMAEFDATVGAHFLVAMQYAKSVSGVCYQLVVEPLVILFYILHPVFSKGGGGACCSSFLFTLAGSSQSPCLRSPFFDTQSPTCST